jgi:hypothetical protein
MRGQGDQRPCRRDRRRRPAARLPEVEAVSTVTVDEADRAPSTAAKVEPTGHPCGAACRRSLTGTMVERAWPSADNARPLEIMPPFEE